MTDEVFEVYALRYATREARRPENFHGGDPHDAPMPMDYFVWVLVSPHLTAVVDTGFTPEVAERRGRTYLRCPTEALSSSLEIDASTVPLVVLTHLHYDHVGNLDKFPGATFVVQEDEMAFWTGRYAGREHFRQIVEAEDVVHLVRENFRGRLLFVNGTQTLAPGLKVHRVGGHSPGMQIVEVESARGTVVVASDACHYYENLTEDRPFSIVADLAEMYGAFDKVRTVAGTEGLIVPGHDPLVMHKHEALEGLGGVAVKIA